MNIAICDNCSDDLNMMMNYCKQYDQRLHVDVFLSGKDLKAASSLKFYNIVFLTIEIESLDVYDIALELYTMKQRPIIIFITKNLDYSVFRHEIALWYLSKPISYNIFSIILYQALQIIAPFKISIPHQRTQKVVRVSRIIYIEVFRHQIIFHMDNQSKLEFRGSLKKIKDQISSSWFVQCHKSFCVNLHHIDSVTAQSVIMTNQDIIPLSKSKKEFFEQKLQEFLRRNSYTFCFNLPCYIAD